MGDEDREPFDSDAVFAAAEIVEPDDTGGEACAGIFGFATRTYCRPTTRSLAEEGSREAGREALFQVGFRGEFDDIPPGEFAGEEESQTLAEDGARVLLLEFVGGGAGAVD